MRTPDHRSPAALAVLVLLLLGMGCSGNDYSRSDTPVFLVVQIDETGDNENLGNTIAEVSNVDDLCSDITDFSIEAREIGGPFSDSPFLEVVLTNYYVWYENRDAPEDIPGVTVPDPFDIAIAATVDTTSGSTTSVFNAPFILAQAKTVAPLNNSTGIGYPIRLLAHLGFQGHMRSNDAERVNGELTMEVDVISAGPTAGDPDQCQ